MQRIRVIDSHTEGEPTRVVVEGGPDLGIGSAAERREVFAQRFDNIRSAIIEEPRGHDAIVGAFLQKPSNPDAVAQVIYFNNSGMLGMCVHGSMGLAVTLVHMGRIKPGTHRVETPVGDILLELHDDGSVSVTNVRSYRHLADVAVETERYGTIVGDVAWGGNWFFLANDHGQAIEFNNIPTLNDLSLDIKRSLAQDGVTGDDGREIDHIELFSYPDSAEANSKNFVYCPGGAYDRSPCGTGTSAKMACLVERGLLVEGESWVQESIIGSCFTGSVKVVEGGVIPTLRGRAYVTGENTLVLGADDPFRAGIRL